MLRSTWVTMDDFAAPMTPRRMPPAPRARTDREAESTDASREPEAMAAPSGAEPRLGPDADRSSATAAANTPAQIGRYRVLGTLGQGGVGVVYEGVDESLGRSVALKVLLDRAPDHTARFRREARAMSRLSHPNVAAVYEVQLADDAHYIAMELVRGQTLRQWLAAAPRDCAEIIDVIQQAGAGLAAAHAAGLVHRDVKPDNVLVGDDGRVRLVDFGLAKHRSQIDDSPALDPQVLARELADAGITRTGALMGTPSYMAPEAFYGDADAHSDQFALCVMLYEALYGQRPFEGETAEQLLDATQNGRLRSWPQRADVPGALTRVLRRGLEAQGDRRYRSMPALLDAITVAARGRTDDRPRHRTKGTRSWKWRVAGVATGFALAAMRALLGPASAPAEPQSTVTDTAPVADPRAPALDDDRRADRRDSAEARQRAASRPAQS